MATRSTIALEFADGSVSQVYCHWDGYLENNGAILAEHYTDAFKVRELIDLGDISSLKPEIGEKHAFSQFETKMSSEDYDKLYGEMTTFYTRDRGETGCEARRYMNVDEYFAECQQEEYDYILRQVEGKAVWFVRCFATDGKWVTLGEAQGLIERMNEEECY